VPHEVVFVRGDERRFAVCTCGEKSEGNPDVWVTAHLQEKSEALRIAGVDQASLERAGMDSTKAWRVIYNARKESR
jgi:Trk K+ transport system NAD-binding subunit